MSLKDRLSPLLLGNAGRRTRGYVLRRENKDGTISFVLRYQVDGKRHKVTVAPCVAPENEAKGQLFADEELARLRYDVKLGLPLPGEAPRDEPDMLTWRRASALYLARLPKHHEPSTTQRYTEIHNNFLASRCGPKLLAETTEQHAEKLQEYLLEAGKAPRSVNNELDALRACWNWCAKKPRRWVEGDKLHNPFSLPHLRNADGGKDRPVRIFTPEEIAAVRAVSPAHIVRVFDFALNTGLRSGELVWLHVEDLDLDARFVLVRARAEHRVKDQAMRSVPLNDRAFEVAVEQVDGRKSGFLFPAPQKGLRWAQLGDQVRYYVRRGVGLERNGKGPSIHTCRSTFCSHALRATHGDLALVQKWLGHENIETTRRYLTFVAEHEKAAIRGLVMP